MEFREPHTTGYILETAAALRTSATTTGLASGQRPQWTRAQIEGSTNTVEMGNRVVLQLEPGQNVQALVQNRNLTISRRVSTNLFILQAADSQSAIEAAESLASASGVAASYPVMRRAAKRHNSYARLPDDPLFSQAWHLDNRDATGNLAGPDLNARGAWASTRGQGVVVGVADDGFQLDHPDLESRVLTDLNFDFYNNTAGGEPAAADADHATCVAGLIAAASDNKVGLTGVAPQAQLTSWVIWGKSFLGGDVIATDEQLMDMFQYASNRVAVQNHSWGNAGTVPLAIDSLSDSGISNAIASGRDGKGVIIVRAAGNERENLANANDDGFANDPRVITVAGVRKDGRACTFSSPGACLLVAGLSGDLLDSNGDGVPNGPDPAAPDVITTDRTGSDGYNASADDTGDYTGFKGTSATAPQIAGVAALILAANPNLTYRDVQQILLQSARHFDAGDPDVHFNGAGFRFSHNAGYGVPDAGFAVDLARVWSNRPPATGLSFINTTRQAIPDDALRVVCAAEGISTVLSSIHCLPTLGPHPDAPTDTLPLVDVGSANEDLTQDLHGKAALIQRGTSYFSDKIARAAKAGAAFAIIYNNVGTTAIQFMGGTTFVPIPAVSISKNDGDLLHTFLANHPETTAQIQLTPAVINFSVADTLICEHIGVRLKTTHTSRQDVRVTLLSPMGTRSVLQAINSDSARGPSDWTYWTTQHFYESSAGLWRLEVSDERSTTVRVGGSRVAATGAVTYAQLLIDGVPITDTDHDGLDDDWERQWFGDLRYGPKDDPDHDGFNNAREQVLGTDPATGTPFKLDFTELKPGYWRLSWPGSEDRADILQATIDALVPYAQVRSVPGRFPTSEYVIPVSDSQHFYQIRR